MSALEKIVVLKLNDKRHLPTLPKSMQMDNVRKLESEFKPKSRDIIRGLSPELERLVLPEYLGVQPHDITFATKTKDFWADFSVQPTAEGLRLNIAMEKKKIKGDDGEFREIDFPVNPEDYWVYQIAMQSRKVAKTSDELSSLSNYDFYIEDLTAVEAKKRTEYEATEKADIEYAKIVATFDENQTKVDWILELLRPKDVFVDVESLEPISKKMMLRKYKEEQPLKFVNTLEDKDLETKAHVIKCATHGILVKEGNDYFYGDENIGSGKVVISWFKKPENSTKVLAIQAKLKAAIETKNTR